jgi:hypothetical protein
VGVVAINGLFINVSHDKGEGKVDIITLKDNRLVHRQIERRNGLTFMRAKKLRYG